MYRHNSFSLLAIIALTLQLAHIETHTIYGERYIGTISSQIYETTFNDDLISYTNMMELTSQKRPKPEDYQTMRETVFRYEEAKSLGADVKLSKRELMANEIIMQAKTMEYQKGLITPHLFNPSQHIFRVLEKIRESPLFAYISMMPKGAVLHAHDTALCSTEYLLTITYRKDLWICQTNGTYEAIAFLFAKSQPINDNAQSMNCTWDLLSKVRQQRSAKIVDDYLRDRFTLYPTEKFLDVNAAWQQFMDIFGLLDGLLTYAPVWADYYYNALVEFEADGVQYLEFRSTLPKLYDMDGTNYTLLDTVRIYNETLTEFLEKHPNFIGSKLIYAPPRNVNDTVLEEYIATCIEIKQKYPDFFAGFDLVGQEELGRPLKDFVPHLLKMPENIDFYFHAGETNWYGSSVDENLIDAVLLGTKRIGHGFALLKHPIVLRIMKEQNIAVEINPVSNQVLQLVADYRNHPCSHLFADNYPVVISSDDPSFWKATPLSHDYYVAFLGIASAHTDMRLLKKLAINSLQYSSMSAAQKVTAINKWQKQWDRFINNIYGGEVENMAGRGPFQASTLD